MSSGDLIIIVIKIVVLFAYLMTFATIATWAERKESAVIQDRHGANRANILGLRIFGLFQPIADTIKMFFKEDYIPPFVDKLMYVIAPSLSFFFSSLVIIMIPFGPELKIGGKLIKLQLIDPDITLLLLFSISALSIYGVILGGWSSRNKYGFLGGMRATAQVLSYEVALILSLVSYILVFPSMKLSQIVEFQGNYIFSYIPKWGIFLQPLGFIIFFIAAIAETKRAPFDMPEGESEIIGFFVEHGAMRYGLFMVTDFVEVIMLSLLTSVLFFGGWQVPYLFDTGFIFPWGKKVVLSSGIVFALRVIAFQIKVIFTFWFLLLVRWTFPRYRFDQLMELGWKALVPLSLFNLLLTAVFVAFL